MTNPPHFRLRPSKAHMWMTCPGHLLMEAQFPEIPGSVDNTVRDEGIAAHWASHRISLDDWVPVGEVAPNRVILTDELLDMAHGFIQECKSWGTPTYHEMTLPAYYIHPECGGTPDAWSYDEANRLLRIADLKAGYRWVDVFENWQLLIYYAAILDHLKIDGYVEQKLMVEFIIYQPRAFSNPSGPVQRWRVKATDLRGLLNKIISAAVVAGQPNAPLRAGAHCGDCSARYACPALQRATGLIFDTMAHATPHNLDSVQLATALALVDDASEVLDAMRSGLAIQAEHIVRHGGLVPGYIMKSSQGRLAWNEGVKEEVIQIAQAFNKPIIKPTELITPTQAKDFLPAALIDALATRKAGSLKLTRMREHTIRKLLGSSENAN